MKVLRSCDWRLVGFDDDFKPLDGSPVFYFQHRKFRDVAALKVAKYVLVDENIVLFFNASAKEKICVSPSKNSDRASSLIHGFFDQLGLNELSHPKTASGCK